jgi:hypothetical protein
LACQRPYPSSSAAVATVQVSGEGEREKKGFSDTENNHQHWKQLWLPVWNVVFSKEFHRIALPMLPKILFQKFMQQHAGII